MIVRVDTAAGTLTAGADVVPCAIGGGGACPAAAKREGDRCTPLGAYPLRAVLLRRDRVATPSTGLPVGTTLAGLPVGTPTTGLPWRWLRADDGWSDDPRDPAYNRPVRHPHAFSAERLWRDDGAYDVVVVIGHNDVPVVAGAGSAIFLHCAAGGGAAGDAAAGDGPAGRPTAGCIAVARRDLLALLPRLGITSTIEIA